MARWMNFGTTSGSRQRRRTIRVSIVVAVTLLLAACDPIAPSGADGTYVALGDSYVAGPGIPALSGDAPAGCLQSTRNYPAYVAGWLDVAERDDRSCSGAVTDDLFSAQSLTGPDNPPQLDALDADTEVVTLGIGGNDIGFTDIIFDCIRILPWNPCVNSFTAGGGDEVSDRIADLEPNIDAVLAEIAARAPTAGVFVVGYPAILPEQGDCWPVVPFLEADVDYLRDKLLELNAMLADRAAANGATYIDIYTPTIGHDVCQDDATKWFEGIFPSDTAFPVHPNLDGMTNISITVTLALIAAGYGL